jgi:hypothetical protein
VIRPGEEWGTPTDAEPDIEIAGDDVTLAHAIAAAPRALIRFRPDPHSDLARAVGLRPEPDPGEPDPGETDPGEPDRGEPEPGKAGRIELPLDALALHDGTLACNMCVLGTPPDRLRWRSPAAEVEVRLDGRPWFAGRASTIVIAVGQFLRGLDVVPRGHPGDGRAEVQVYELERRERRPMRARLATGAHVPNPRIHQRSARTIEVHCASGLACEIDGAARPAVDGVEVEVVPGAYHLLV